jgi:ATP-dependent Clp protease protease subunit
MFNKALFGSFAVLATLFALSFASAGNEAPKSRNLVLEKRNTIAFRMPVTGSTVKDVQLQLLKLDASLGKGEPIYLYLDTPGGSITAGQELITTVRGLKHEVKTITNFAASMGYIFVQNLGERLILPNGTLMSHRAFISGMEGQMPGEFNTRTAYWNQRVSEIENACAERVKMTHENYNKLVKDEYWVDGAAAVAANHADAVVNVSCGPDLQSEETQTLQTIFGAINVVWSTCPLISSPVRVEFGDSLLFTTDTTQTAFKKTVYDVLYNKRSFVDDVVVRNNFIRNTQ